MSKRNQSELSSYIQALAATHTETAYKAVLDDEMNQSMVHKKAATQAVTNTGTLVINFGATQLATLDMTGGNASLSFTNIESGQTVYLSVTKSASTSLSFTGVINTSYVTNYDALTLVKFRIKNIGGTIYVTALTAFPADVSAVYTDATVSGVVDNSANSLTSASSLRFVTFQSGALLAGSLAVTLTVSTTYIDVTISNIPSGKNFGGSQLRGSGSFMLSSDSIPIGAVSSWYTGTVFRVYFPSAQSAGDYLISLNHASQA